MNLRKDFVWTIIGSFVGSFLLVLFLSVIANLPHPLRNRIRIYSTSTLYWGLIAAGVLISLAVLAAANSKRRGNNVSPWRIVVPVVYTVLLFLGMTALLDPRHSSTWPYNPDLQILISVVALGLLLLFGVGIVSGRSKLVEARSGETSATEIGFAATSVLVDYTDSANPNFVLVLNRNFEGHDGLWLSPGGHFVPGTDDPLERLTQKIQSEVGVVASRLTTFDHEGLATSEVRWVAAPDFVLCERLPGRCRLGHQHHYDFVYVMQVDGQLPIVPQYPQSQRIVVPVSPCAPSRTAAYNALAEAVDDWERAALGQVNARHATVTRDVSDRLHLVAESLMASSPFTGDNSAKGVEHDDK